METEEITENMELDKSPFFRKIIIPWYDSELVCWVVILWALFVFIFALTGVQIAVENHNFNKYLWFPSGLLGLSFFLTASTIFRMIRRNIKG